MEIELESAKEYEVVERRVKPMGTGAGVHLPLSWLGKLVKVVRVED